MRIGFDLLDGEQLFRRAVEGIKMREIDRGSVLVGERGWPSITKVSGPEAADSEDPGRGDSAWPPSAVAATTSSNDCESQRYFMRV
jgi:hypothetical protein